jgi:hypothetical protein
MPETCRVSWQNKILDTWCISLVTYTKVITTYGHSNIKWNSKLSLCLILDLALKTCVEARYSSMPLNLEWRCRWVISFLHLTTVTPVKEPRLRIAWVTWWVPASIWKLGRKKEYLCLPGIELRSTGSSCLGLVTMLTEPFRQVLAYTLCVTYWRSMWTVRNKEFNCMPPKKLVWKYTNYIQLMQVSDEERIPALNS